MFSWMRARGRASAVSAIVLTASLTGPLALYLHARQMGQPDPASAEATTPAELGPQVAVGPFAALFVSTWLQGGDLGVFNSSLAAEPTGLLVDQAAAVRVNSSADGFYDVVVAVDAVDYLPGSEEEYRDLALRFYQVGIETVDDGSLLVLGPPSLVGAPLAPTAAGPAVGDFDLTVTEEEQVVAETLRGFFTAYLTGQGDVALFTAPSARLSPAVPAPYTSIAIGRLGWNAVPGIDDPDLRLVRVEVVAARAAGREVLEYWLVSARRDGRWEVAQLLPSPVVVGRAGSGR